MNSQVKENPKKVCTAQGSPCSSNVGPVRYCAVSKNWLFGAEDAVFVWMYIGIPKVSWAYARKGTAGYASVCFPDFCHPHRYNLPLENIGIINHELPIYIRYLRTALNECSMLLALLAIWTNANYSWAKTLVLCRRQEIVLCRQPIGCLLYTSPSPRD